MGKTIIHHTPNHRFYRWYKPFPVIGSLWHCFTGFTPMSDNCRVFFLEILHKKKRPRAQVSPRSSPHHLTLPQHRREEFALPWPGPVIMAGKTRTQWLVGGWATPLKNDGLRQLGWWHSQYDGKNKSHVPNHQPDGDVYWFRSSIY